MRTGGYSRVTTEEDDGSPGEQRLQVKKFVVILANSASVHLCIMSSLLSIQQLTLRSKCRCWVVLGRAVLCCAVCCAVLCCAVLCCAVLCCAALCCPRSTFG